MILNIQKINYHAIFQYTYLEGTNKMHPYTKKAVSSSFLVMVKKWLSICFDLHV